MKKIENVRFWRDPDLPGLEARRVLRSRHSFPKHTHDDIFAIGLNEEGGAYCVRPEDSSTLLPPGRIVLINPGQVHSGVPETGVRTTYSMLYAPASIMKEAAGEIYETDEILPEFTRMIIHDPALFKKLQHLVTLLTRDNGDRRRLEKDAALVEALSDLISRYGGVRKLGAASDDAFSRRCWSPPPRKVRMAMEFLDEDLSEKITLKDVADAVGVSRYHFLRVFKKAAGVPPHVYRTQRRIEAAKGFLRQGTPLVDVALETGFTDQSHFTNKFRQFTGVTPRQYLAG
ncbi:MAG: AraC family transcriptional regulator [Desulfobacterales bacterium]|nr:AraC family transcriptional regulator [Desulfobacterales bacterium]